MIGYVKSSEYGCQCRELESSFLHIDYTPFDWNWKESPKVCRSIEFTFSNQSDVYLKWTSKQWSSKLSKFKDYLYNCMSSYIYIGNIYDIIKLLVCPSNLTSAGKNMQVTKMVASWPSKGQEVKYQRWILRNINYITVNSGFETER